MRRALTLQRQGHAARAIAAFQAALEFAPDEPAILRPLATLLMAQSRAADAVPHCRRLARLQPNDAGTVVALGYALIESGEPAEAVRLVEAATHAHKQDARLPHLIGHALQRLGMPGPAIGAFYCALELDPAEACIHASLANALLAEHQVTEAEAHATEAFRRAPTQAHAATLSCILIERGRLADALAAADRGIAAGRPGPEVLVNRSIALDGLGRRAEAVAAARRAMAVAPTAVTTHNLAALLLTHGQLTPEAWTLYESRLRLNGAREWPVQAPRWRGEDVAGRTVLLHAEQGLGDTIQFARYVPLVAACGARPVLVVQPALKRLLAGMAPAAQVVAVGETLPPFDVFTPLLSLPGLFGTTLETVPPPLPVPPPPPRQPGPVRVGIAWAGSGAFVEDRKRSIPGAALWSLAEPGRVVLHSLQYPRVALPPGIVDAMQGISDMQDTADRLASLDLVITVDTAVAHLAAALGKPVWMLSRFRGCWRWLQHRADSPWYPSLTIYRQPAPNDWESVVAQLRADLAAYARPTV